MITRYELDRKNVKREDFETYKALIAKGYSVLRKSKSTKILVLWGDEFSQEDIDAKEAVKKVTAERAKRFAIEMAERFAQAKRQLREERMQEVTIANLWKNFCRKPQAYINLKRNSFYFTTPRGQKVRVSDHESWHFTNESERSNFSTAASFDAADFDFTLEDFNGKTRAEVVAFIKANIL